MKTPGQSAKSRIEFVAHDLGIRTDALTEALERHGFGGALAYPSLNMRAVQSAPVPGVRDYQTLADLHTIKGWLHGLASAPDLDDVVADGGATAGMVYQQEATEFAGRVGRIIAALSQGEGREPPAPDGEG